MSKLWNYSCSQLTLRPIFIEAANDKDCCIWLPLQIISLRYKKKPASVWLRSERSERREKDQTETFLDKSSLTNRFPLQKYLTRFVFAIFSNQYRKDRNYESVEIEFRMKWHYLKCPNFSSIKSDSEKKPSILLRPWLNSKKWSLMSSILNFTEKEWDYVGK